MCAFNKQQFPNNRADAHPDLQDLGEAKARLRDLEESKASAQADFDNARQCRDYAASAVHHAHLKEVGVVILIGIDCRW